MMCILSEADPTIWNAVPTLLWVGLIVGVLIAFWKQVSEIVNHFVSRVRSGAAMKFYGVEVGAVQSIDQNIVPAAEIGVSSAQPEELENSPWKGLPISSLAYQLSAERHNMYALTRRIMLVHRLFRSSKMGQVYDVLIYLVPQSDGSLIEVTKVEYFLGRYWGNQIFESFDRSRGFPIVTSAYGTALAMARVTFNDGTTCTLYRYLDFEMGASAPTPTGLS